MSEARPHHRRSPARRRRREKDLDDRVRLALNLNHHPPLQFVRTRQRHRRPSSAQTGTKTAEWPAVQSISPGTKIVVRTKDGDRLTGRFESANDQAISFTQDGKRVSLTRDSVGRVQINRGKSRLKGALVGTG